MDWAGWVRSMKHIVNEKIYERTIVISIHTKKDTAALQNSILAMLYCVKSGLGNQGYAVNKHGGQAKPGIHNIL